MSPQQEPKKRGKYGRPCDRCASRRIRCLTSENSTSCTGCQSSGEKCTRDRVRKKSGPKNGRRDRSVFRQSLQNTIPYFNEMNAVDNLIGESNLDRVEQSNSPESLKDHPVHQAIAPAGSSMLVAPDVQNLQNHLIRPPDQFEYLTQQRVPPDDTSYLNHNRSHFPQYFSYCTQPPRTAPSQSGPALYSASAQPLSPHRPSFDSPCLADYKITQTSSIPSELNLIGNAAYNENILSAFKTSSSPHIAKIPLECLISRFQIFQTWFYGYWPVISFDEVISALLSGAEMRSPNEYINLTKENAMSYALCCSVCAAVTTQLSFVSPENIAYDHASVSDDDFANEAKRVRDLFDYTDRLEVETLLSSFFLYAHYTNLKGKIKRAKLYLREAISMAQAMNLHVRSQYKGRSRAEVHRRRKIYYILLVTERYVCFEEGLPVILDPCIDFPDIADEEFPDLLVGFSELIRIFAVPSKEFFLEMNQNRHENSGGDRPLYEKRQWILEVQERLGRPHQLPKNVTNPQKLNIILSKAWIRAIACHITWNNGMIQPSDDYQDCFGFDFPLINAREFLAESSYLPNMAFETNGPGICVKLLEMANSLSFTVKQSSQQLAGLAVLESLFGLVNKFKNDVTLPIKVYQGIASLISTHKLKVVPRLIENQGAHTPHEHQSGIVEELFDDGSTNEVTLSKKDELADIRLSPFSQQMSDQDPSLLASIPSFLNMRYAHAEVPPLHDPGELSFNFKERLDASTEVVPR